MYCFNIVNEILVVISIGYKPVTTAPQSGVYTPLEGRYGKWNKYKKYTQIGY
jgi:hypothetical protein